MSPQNNGEKLSGAPREKKEHSILQDAEGIRAVLKIEDSEENWKEVVSKVFEDVRTKEESGSDSKFDKDLQEMAVSLELQRQKVAKFLLSAVSISREGLEISEARRNAILIPLATYLHDLEIYNHYFDGTNPVGTSLPEYLQDAVKDKESQGFSIKSADVILPTQFDIADAIGSERSPSMISSHAIQILQTASNRKMKMKYILSCLDDSGGLVEDKTLYTDLLEAAGIALHENDDDIEAARFVAAFFGKHIDTIQKSADIHGISPEELTISDALDCCIGNAAMAKISGKVGERLPDLSNALRAKGVDIRPYIKEVYEDKSTYPQRLLEIAMLSLRDKPTFDSDKERAAFHKDSQEVMQFFMEVGSKKISVRNVLNQIGNRNDQQRKIILRLLMTTTGSSVMEKIAGEKESETLTALLKEGGWNKKKDVMLQKIYAASMIPEDPEDRNWEEVDTAKALEELLSNGDIYLREAFDLYYFTSQKQGASMAMSFKLVDILQEHGHGRLAFYFQQNRLAKYLDIALSSATDLSKLAVKFNLTPEQEVELKNVGKFMYEKSGDALMGIFDSVSALVQNYPKITATIGIVTTYAGHAVFDVWRSERFAGMGANQIKEAFPALKDVPVDRIKSLKHEIQQILARRDRLGAWGKMIAGRPMRINASLIVRASKNGDLSGLVKALKHKYGNASDIAEFLYSTTPRTELENALKANGFKPQQVSDAMEHAKQAAVNQTTRQLSQLGSEVGEVAAEVSELVAGRSRDFQRRLSDIHDELRRIESLTDRDAIKGARAALKETVVEFMDDFNKFEGAHAVPGLRRNLASSLLGDVLEDGFTLTDDLWDAVEAAHKIPMDEAGAIGKKFDTIMDALAKVEIEGLDDAARIRIVKRLLHSGLTGEVPSSVASMTLNSVDDVRRLAPLADSAEELEDLVRRGSHMVETLDEAESLLRTVNDDTVEVAARSLGAADDLARTTDAIENATDAARSTGALRGVGSKVIGKSLFVFGVLVDGYTMHLVNEELKYAQKVGDKGAERILRSKFNSKATEIGVGTVGIPAAFAFSGPVGWLALGGLAAKGITSDYLYDYALDLNNISTKKYKRKSPEQLVEIMEGEKDWLLDSKDTQEVRHDTALYAYIAKSNIIRPTGLDQALANKRYSESETAKNPDAQLKRILSDKAGQYYTSMVTFLRDNHRALSRKPLAQRLDYAESFAKLRYMKTVSSELGKDGYVDDYYAELRLTDPKLAASLPDDISSIKSSELFKVLDAMRVHSKIGLYYKYVMFNQLVRSRNMQKSEAVFELFSLFNAELLTHDAAVYKSDFSDDNSFDNQANRLHADSTLYFVLSDEINDMLREHLGPDEFMQRLEEMHMEFRTFLSQKRYVEDSDRDIWGKRRMMWRNSKKKF